MGQNADVTRALAADAQGLDQLKLQAKRNPQQAIGGAAKQFEAMFLGMVMKSMRDATPQNGLFDNSQTRMYTQMLDQQLAQHLAARGTGLAQVITRQLGQSTDASSAQIPGLSISEALGNDIAPPTTGIVPGPRLRHALRELDDHALDNKRGALPAAAPAQNATPRENQSSSSPGMLDKAQTFVNRVWNHAVEAARSLGVQPHFMVGQAALESGWGRSEIKASDGSPSYNLFGIKAGRGWHGRTVERTTTEYVNGVPQKTKEKFRVYSSYSECFQDYANLLRNNPRYSNVLNCAQDARAFAQGLQQAGYATDPSYGDKLLRIINGSALRQGMQT